MKKRHSFFPRLLASQYSKYISNYISFALAACMMIGFFMLMLSTLRLDEAVMTQERQRMQLATAYVDEQFEILEEISDRVLTTAYYKPYYFERNSIYEMDIVKDLAKHEGYSPIVSDIRLLYREMPGYIYGTKSKSDFAVYAQQSLCVDDAEAFADQLMQVEGSAILFADEGKELLLAVYELSLMGKSDPSGDAVLCFTIPLEGLLAAMEHMSGISAEDVVSLYWEGKPLFEAGKVAKQPEEAQGLLSSSTGRCTLVIRMQGMLHNSSIMSLCITGILIIVAVMLVLAVFAVIAARRNYKPIADIADRFQLKPEDEFKQIEHLLSTLHETNETSQREMTQMLDQLNTQQHRLKAHLMLSILGGTYQNVKLEQLESVGVSMHRALFCAIALHIRESIDDEKQMTMYIESLSDSQMRLAAVRVSHQNHYAIIVNGDDAYSMLGLREVLQDMMESQGVSAAIGMGEVVRGLQKLSGSMQTALYGLYQEYPADVSMFGGGAMQRLLDAAEAGEAQEAGRLFDSMCLLIAQSYPLSTMQQSIFVQIGDNINELALHYGLPDLSEELHRLLLMGASERYVERMHEVISAIATAADFHKSEELNRRDELLRRIMSYIEENACSNQFSQEVVAETFGISERQVGRIVKGATDLSYKEYVVQIKIDRAKELLSQGVSVSETCVRIGYANIPHFIKKFKEKTGVTPGSYKSAQ